MKRVLRLILLFTFGLGLIACAKEDPIPEERDPIYQDLLKREAEHTKMAEEATAKVKELREQLEKAEANSIEKKDIARDLAKHTAGKLDHEQWSRYYKIRLGRRKVVDRITYRQAFAAQKDKEWPNPKEYEDYLANRRLVEVSRNWGSRVPKLQDRVAAASAAKNEEKKAEH